MPMDSDNSPNNRDEDVVRSDDLSTSPPASSDEWSNFNQHFLELSNPKTSSGLALFTFLRIKLKQFHLDTAYSEIYLLHEAYIRAHRLIQNNGVAILYPDRWLRKTLFNILRELSRTEQATISIEETAIEPIAPSAISDAILKQELEVLKQAAQRLDPEELKLLNLKIVQGESWHSIRLSLAQDGVHLSEPTLRKKKERTLRKLRQIYHALKPLSDLDS